ncbi:hypothetical protein WP8W19C02_17800 [Enterobacter cloacae]|nr:hypothetical protein WP8W19C02_17800 [Enterobacter cloacae]
MTHGINDGDEILTVNQYGGRKGSPQIVRGAFCYSGLALRTSKIWNTAWSVSRSFVRVSNQP